MNSQIESRDFTRSAPARSHVLRWLLIPVLVSCSNSPGPSSSNDAGHAGAGETAGLGGTSGAQAASGASGTLISGGSQSVAGSGANLSGAAGSNAGASGGSPCVAGGACPAPGGTCTDVSGASCTCVGPDGSAYITCNSAGSGGSVGAAGSSGAAGSPGASGSPGAAGSSGAGGGTDIGTTTQACAGSPPWITGTAQTKLTVDAGQRGAAWSRFYEKGVAADHANTVLSTAWGRNIQGALRKGHDLAGFQYARFHGVLDSDIGVYSESNGAAVYNWTRFDQVYDGLAGAGMRPVVEISFMPPPLASDTSSAAALHWYNGAPANKSKPKDWTKWQNFMTAIVQHLETRYGAAEVRNNWYFEVWNEASWMYSGGEAGYPELYNNTVKGLLAGDAQVKVGGPAGSAASSLEQIPSITSYAKSNNLKLDFVSWHRYGNDGTQANYADANGMLAYFDQLSGVIANTGFKGLSMNDEWGPSYDANVIRDSEVSASFIAKTVHLIGTDPKFPPPFMFGYWTISDLYEEFDSGGNLAYREGNYGLMLKGDPRYPVSFDVEKPAFNAFRLLHLLGDVQLNTSGGTTANGVNALATITSNGSAIQVLVYNHVNGGPGDSAASALTTLTVNNLPFSASHVSVKQYMVDRAHSNSYRLWVAQGKPAQPSQAQWTALASTAKLCYYSTSASTTGNTWTVTYPQNVYGVSLFVLSP